MKKFPSRESGRLLARALKRLQIRRATLFVTLFAVLLSTFTFVNQSPARADTAGTGACTQTFTKTGTGTVDVVESGGYCYVAFKNTGAVDSQTSFSWTRPTGINVADVLVIGGGGGAGARHGGGGGAGAFVETSNFIISSASDVSVVVGAGGAGAPGAAGSLYVGSRGQASSFRSGSNGLTAIGGGAGVNGTGNVDGGSGGGSGWNQTAGVVTTSPPQTQTSFAGATLSGITFGSNGAQGANEGVSGVDFWAGGGGGGAASPGALPTNNGTTTTTLSTAALSRGGNGGAGKAASLLTTSVATSLAVGQISGSSVFFAGGGGGGMGEEGASGGTGGVGGGANGTRIEATGNNGAATTGGGGGGSGFSDFGVSANPEGGDGGSGVVVIRYALTGEILRFDATNPDSYTSGTTWNDLASSKNASLINGTAFNSRTKAFDFDGVNDYVDLPDLTNDLSNGFAIHAVADFGAAKNWERLFEFSAGGTTSGIVVARDALSNQLVAEAYKGAVGSSCRGPSDSIQPGFRAYSLVVQPNGTCQFYRDGVALTTTGSLGWDTVATRTANFLGADRDLVPSNISIQSFVMYNTTQVTPLCRPYETTTSTHKVLQFSTVGTCSWTNPTSISNASYLTVAGGGAGGFPSGNNRGPGGGGAGGLLTGTTNISAATHSIVVGRGGAPVTSTDGNGANSSAFSISATGGGRGGTAGDPFPSGAVNANGAAGGSGGGAANSGGSVGGASPSGQGNAGGAQAGDFGAGGAGGGGGGAGRAGYNASGTGAPANGGNGGDALANSITGVSTPYAGGGGGAHGGSGTGGTGAGGVGGSADILNGAAAQSGLSGRGGGGGGSRLGTPGAGGSGIVIVSYALPNQAALSITSTSALLGSTLALATSGGTGSGAVTYAVTTSGTAGCSVSGSTLSFTSAGTCSVSATKASDGVYAVVSSGATTITITALTVTYDSKGGPSVASGTFLVNGSISEPTAPVRSGYTFGGWSATDGGTAVTWPYSPGGTSNITLYAKWTANQSVDYSLELSGTAGQYGQVSSGQILPATGAFTLETWFKPAADVSNNGNAVLISQGTNGGRFYLKRNSTGSMIYLREGAGAEATCGTAPGDAWAHIAITYSSGTTTCFLNGVQQSTQIASTSLLTGFVVGDYAAGLNSRVNTWKGSIDEVRVYNTARTATQIAADAHAYATITDSSLIAYYDFNEGTGTTGFNKKSGATSATNLTLSGTPTFADVAVATTTSTSNVVTFPRTYLNNMGGWAAPSLGTSLSYLVVGGGGGGGIGIDTQHGGGGGGAGGYRTNVSGATSGRNSSAEASFTVADSRYPVVVGFGGSAQPSRYVEATNGGSSTFATITSLGGGRGANYYEFSANVGGSGGGGAASNVALRLPGAAGTTAQGFGGGNGHNDRYGAGGGGAGSAGSNATSSSPGAGGAGLASTISGSSVTRAAGGIGGHSTTGGAGVSGAPNTGNGGSGGNVNSGTIQTAGSGGSGIVIVSYVLPAQAALSITTTSALMGSALTLATSGGTGSGAVTYVVTSAGATGCSVSGSTLSFTSAGTCSVTATKAAADGYAAVSSSATAITITNPLIAYESFDVATFGYNSPGGTGNTGFSGNWLQVQSTNSAGTASSSPARAANSILNSEMGRSYPAGVGFTLPSTSNGLQLADSGGGPHFRQVARALSSPISMNSDSSYYLAFRAAGAGDDVQLMAGFMDGLPSSTTDTSKKALLMGLVPNAGLQSQYGIDYGAANRSAACPDNGTDTCSATTAFTAESAISGGVVARSTENGLSYGHFVLAKVTARASGNDTVQLKYFARGATIPMNDSAITWDVTYSSAITGSFSHLTTQMSGTGFAYLDEIRTGFTYASVVNPVSTSVLTLNPNFTGATTTTQTVSTGVDTVLAPASRSGYTFDGWNTNADGTSGTNYTATQAINVSSDTTLFAKWTLNLYRYNANTGSNPPADQTFTGTTLVASSGAGMTAPAGHYFTGWCTGQPAVGTNCNNTGYSAGDNLANPFSTITSLFAVWTPIQTVDSSLELSGASGQYGQVSSNQVIPSTGAFTLQTWFKAPSDVSSNANAHLISHGSGSNRFYIKRASTGAVTYFRGSVEAACGVAPENQWTHVAITYNGSGTSTCFLNGVQASTLTNSASINTNFVIGANSASLATPADTWKGSIDEVRVYNTVRTATQIAADAHAYATITDSTLVVYYDFNEGSGTSITNKKGAAVRTFNLVLTGSPTFADVAETSTVSGRTVKIFKRSYLNNAGGWTVPVEATSLDVLTVGGGGAGGSANNGAGGGGGGGRVLAQTGQTLTGVLGIKIGQGGVPVQTAGATPGGNGDTTSVTPTTGSAISALGGSGGATAFVNTPVGSPSTTGYNGAGGAVWATSVTNGSAGVGGTSGGNAQGSGSSLDAQIGGGGGGAGANGSNGSVGGNGGAGVANSYATGSNVFYGGGGGGGRRTNGSGSAGTGGSSVGGNGGAGVGSTSVVGGSAVANSGGGGGGAGAPNTTATGGSGAAGIVVIRYGLENQAALTVTSTAGTTGSTLALTTSGGSGSGSVSYVVTTSGTAGCSVSGSTLSFTSTGTCTVTATKASADGFSEVSSSATTITITAGIYTVTYNYDNATGGNSTATADFTVGGTAITLPTPTRTGYTFAGWFEASNLSGSALGSTYSPTQSRNIYAKWTANTYTVTYNYDNATGGNSTATADFTVGGTAITLPTPTRTGYTFAGWHSDSAKTVSVGNAGASYSPTASLTLYAEWTANAQAITYLAGVGGSGTGPSTPATVLYDTSFTTPANTFTRTGYSFAGWSDGTSVFAASARYPATGVVTGPVSLVATWTANAQNITYAAGTGGSGTGPSTPATVLYDASFTTPANTFTRAGYTFAGWSDGTTVFAASARYPASGGVTGPVTLTATWSAGSNVVTYDSKGGTVVADGSFTTGGSIANAPTDPTRTGYIFAGWSATDGGTAITFPYSPTATTGITLFARWTEITYTITYVVNGATGSPERSSDTYTYTGGAVTLSNVGSMAKTGYRFDGWQLNGTTTKLASSYTPVANVTLQARWAAVQYTITYFSNSGGTPPVADSYTTGDPALTLPTQGSMARTGYTFNGWSTTVNNVSTKVATTITTTAPVNLFALWTAVPYSVTYSNENSTGGSVPTDATNYNIGNTLIVKANSGTLVRTGYSFAGWTLISGGSGTTYQSGDTYTVGSADLTFYPKWTANTYIISYNANGASGTPARTSDTYTTAGSTISLPNVGTMAKTGYEFAGWSTSSTGSVHSGAFTTSSDVTLFAIWTIKTIPYGYDRGVAKGTNLTGSHVARFPNPSSINSTYGATVTLPTVGSTSSNISETATVTGSTFKFFGWSYDEVTYSPGATYVLPELVAPETRKVFTAQWVELLAVRYALNGGSGIVDIDPECIQAGDKCLANQVIVLSEAPTRDGYTFAGWRNQANTETKLAGAGVSITDTSYLWYAQWTPIDYSISFNSVGGSLSPATQTKNIGDTVTLPDPGTKTGYTFDGWLVSSTKHGIGTTYSVGTSNVAFTAVWTANRYNVSYNWNGGSGSGSSGLIYTVGTTPITLPTGNARDGYVFDGWQVSGTTTKLGSTFAPTADTLLEARWIDGAYTLTYDNFNGSSNTSASVTRATATTLPTPIRTGFTFDGWYEDANYTLRYGAGGASITPTTSKRLVAKWVQNSLTGINPAHLNALATLNIAGGSSGTWTGNHAQSGTGATLNIPAGALPNGTAVKVSFVEDLTRPASLIENNNAYFTSVVVHWLTGSGDSATVPSAAANKPLVLRLQNQAIVAGAKVYSILAGQVTEVATATVDGEVTLTFYDDPEFVVAATRPGSPTAVTATNNQNAQSTISWNAPLGNGGSAITGYTVTASPGSATCTTTGTSCQITGLTNGTSYTFTVKATNAIDDSMPSSPSSAITPRLALNYNVTFNSNGGSTVGNGSFVENGTLSAPTDPTRANFNFIGWATTDGNESTIISFPYSPSNADLTLYAIWRASNPALNPDNSGNNGAVITPISTKPSATPTPKASASAKPTAQATSSAKPTSSQSPAATPEPTPTQRDVFVNAPKPNAGIDTPNQGNANAIVGDESVETVVTVTEFAKQIEIGDSISISFQATDAAGNQLPTSPDGSVQVVQGASISASGNGFKPDSPVEAWLYSTPVLLGSGLANADGSFDNTYAIDSDFPLGDHTVVLHGISPTDEVVTLALGVTVIADEAASSSSTLLIAILAFLGALLTIGLWLVLRRRSGAHKK